jgi:tRNA pseudouridine38-40 synthase
MTKSQVQTQGAYVVFDFSANAFLQHQVRNMVGALVYIGKGAYPASYMQTMLAQRDRNLAPPTFSPSGLYLTQVRYHEKWRLPLAKNDAKSVTLVI